MHCNGQRLDGSGFLPTDGVRDRHRHGRSTCNILTESTVRRVEAAVFQIGASIGISSDAELAPSPSQSSVHGPLHEREVNKCILHAGETRLDSDSLTHRPVLDIFPDFDDDTRGLMSENELS